jgi:hypothetical protein
MVNEGEGRPSWLHQKNVIDSDKIKIKIKNKIKWELKKSLP